MGVGVELVRIECDVETSSGRSERRRRRRRRMGSDELAFYTAVHDPDTNDLLAESSWARTGVDSGESLAIGEPIIAPTGADPIMITLIGYELDGIGGSEHLAARLVEELSREARGNNFGSPGGRRPGWLDGEPMVLPPLSRSSRRHNLIILDRFMLWDAQVDAERAPYERGFGALPPAAPDISRLARYVPGAATKAVTGRYVAASHHSTYIVELELSSAE